MREEAPVYYNEELDFYALTRHEDVGPALRNSVSYSNQNGPLMEREFWKPDSAKMHSIVAMDPPEHPRWRRLISGSFSPRAIGELESSIRLLTRKYVEEAVECGQFDLMPAVAQKVPMDTISIVIGVPESDRPEVQRLLDGTVHRDDGATEVGEAQMQAFFGLTQYYQELVNERRQQRRSDLVSDLIDSAIDERPLTDHEIIAFLHLLGGASTVTTIDLLGNSWYWAWRNPEQQAAALNGDIRGWVDESLRYDSPVQMVIRRVQEDVKLHGTIIPEGAQILFLMGAANRDPKVFANPDKFDLSRNCDQLLSFSRGPHLCLGNLLARKVARIVLEELVARVADYDIDPDGLKRRHRSTIRGFDSLPTVITLR
jgi:hypothetical protein